MVGQLVVNPPFSLIKQPFKMVQSFLMGCSRKRGFILFYVYPSKIVRDFLLENEVLCDMHPSVKTRFHLSVFVQNGGNNLLENEVFCIRQKWRFYKYTTHVFQFPCSLQKRIVPHLSRAYSFSPERERLSLPNLFLYLA